MVFRSPSRYVPVAYEMLVSSADGYADNAATGGADCAAPGVWFEGAHGVRRDAGEFGEGRNGDLKLLWKERFAHEPALKEAEFETLRRQRRPQRPIVIQMSSPSYWATIPPSMRCTLPVMIATLSCSSIVVSPPARLVTQMLETSHEHAHVLSSRTRIM